ncbi:MAG: SigF/SigG family RNA polymerase sporulation sigma factor [Lachnospiraceae bacterium]|nr:SigF/SigG family RNA polymerase sporulation sigma factor [Lachnospiraceae bacterium]
MEDTLALLERAHQGDKDARNMLVEENVGLVWSIVRRFKNRGVELEDLFQIGSIGLIKAIDKFDTEYDVKFSTYAVPMIMGEIKRYLRDNGMIKVSRSVRELSLKVYHTRERMENRLGREPTLSEIAGELGVMPEEVATAVDAAAEIESLSKVIYQGDGHEIELIDRLEEKKDRNEEVLNQMVLEKAMTYLDDKEKRILDMRYFQDKTQSAIAKELGMSQVQVSRMEKKILMFLRGKI